MRHFENLPPRRRWLSLLAAMLMLTLLTQTSWAERRERTRESPGRWHGADIRQFHERDLATWRKGHWRHGSHTGRLGWWWIVGGVWYLYPAPVKPYPDPYLPPLVEMPPPAPPTSSQYWYFCKNPAGYYPYVPDCPTPWEPVPASPSLSR